MMKIIKNFIIYIVLPFLVASILSLFVLNFMGVKLPSSIRNILPSFAVSGEATTSEDNQKVKSLETTIEDQQKKIDSLKETVGERDSQLDELKAQLESYQQLDNKSEDSIAKSDKEENKKVINIIKEMRPADAAGVLLSMDKQEATAILTGLDQKIVADIMSKMDPAQAAEYLQAIKD